MAATPAQAFKHVCTIMDLGDDGHDYLIKHRIRTVTRMVTTIDRHYVSLITRDPSVINESDLDQIKIFRYWLKDYQEKKGGLISPEDLVADFTADEWDIFNNQFLSQVLHHGDLTAFGTQQALQSQA